MLDGAREISAAAPWRQRATSILSGASRAYLPAATDESRDVSSWTPCIDNEMNLEFYPPPEPPYSIGVDEKPTTCANVRSVGACFWSHSRAPVLYPWRECCPKSCGLCDERHRWTSFNPRLPSEFNISYSKQKERFVRRHPEAQNSPLSEIVKAIMRNSGSDDNVITLSNIISQNLKSEKSL